MDVVHLDVKPDNVILRRESGAAAHDGVCAEVAGIGIGDVHRSAFAFAVAVPPPEQLRQVGAGVRGHDPRRIEYLVQLLMQQARFEMAYNPNDCVELRWGAPDRSAERVLGATP